MRRVFTSTHDFCNIIIVVLVCLLTCLLVLLCMQATSLGEAADPGVSCVRLMYEFETPNDIIRNQNSLQYLLTEDEFSRLTVDDELRAINSYFKFGYAASRIDIVEYSPGCVVYRIANENINYFDIWIFLYDQNEEGKLYNIREYKLIAGRGDLLDEALEVSE